MSSPQPALGAAGVAPRSAWAATLRETTIEVFTTMVGTAVTAPENEDFAVFSEVTGMIGIAGPLSAILSLRCSMCSAALIVSQMLGVSVDEAAALKCDAVGEICNMLAGYFKAKIGLGDLCKLSLPTVLTGKNYQIRSPGKEFRMTFPVLYQKEPLWIALDIRPG
ncbi:MAG: chemotaxis protein CheX [Candidatus Sulfotelmatobacter sp.]|jgi:chemotaxis protein CheX